MKTITFNKRLFIYLIDVTIYSGLAFLSAYPFIFIYKLHIILDILIIIGFILIYSFLINFLLLKMFRGYTIVSAIFGVKVVGTGEKKITTNQAFIRSLNQALWILLLYDLIYILINRTQRGIIDRLTDTFMVDMRY